MLLRAGADPSAVAPALECPETGQDIYVSALYLRCHTHPFLKLKPLFKDLNLALAL